MGEMNMKKREIYHIEGELQLEQLKDDSYMLWFKSDEGELFFIADIMKDKIINGIRFNNPKLFWEKMNQLVGKEIVKVD
jgi:hypothetical protein